MPIEVKVEFFGESDLQSALRAALKDRFKSEPFDVMIRVDCRPGGGFNVMDLYLTDNNLDVSSSDEFVLPKRHQPRAGMMPEVEEIIRKVLAEGSGEAPGKHYVTLSTTDDYQTAGFDVTSDKGIKWGLPDAIGKAWIVWVDRGDILRAPLPAVPIRLTQDPDGRWRAEATWRGELQASTDADRLRATGYLARDLARLEDSPQLENA